MGKQQKLKELRRLARAAKKQTEKESPPDLGVVATEVVDTRDKFG